MYLINYNDVNDGLTVLGVVVVVNDDEMVKFLIGFGVYFDVVDLKGRIVLMRVAEFGYV